MELVPPSLLPNRVPNAGGGDATSRGYRLLFSDMVEGVVAAQPVLACCTAPRGLVGVDVAVPSPAWHHDKSAGGERYALASPPAPNSSMVTISEVRTAVGRCSGCISRDRTCAGRSEDSEVTVVERHEVMECGASSASALAMSTGRRNVHGPASSSGATPLALPKEGFLAIEDTGCRNDRTRLADLRRSHPSGHRGAALLGARASSSGPHASTRAVQRSHPCRSPSRRPRDVSRLMPLRQDSFDRRSRWSPRRGHRGEEHEVGLAAPSLLDDELPSRATRLPCCLPEQYRPPRGQRWMPGMRPVRRVVPRGRRPASRGTSDPRARRNKMSGYRSGVS